MKALVLFSGGLDSMLAIKLLTAQSIDVIAVHIRIGFSGKEDHEVLLCKRAAMAGASLEVVDVQNRYLQEVLFSPRYGYGKQFNPCIDCHGFMFKVAKELLVPFNASFIATGEVIGQRPMSQTRDALKLVRKLANDLEDGLILRPLSAQLLEESKAEREGWVDRSLLLGLSGRGRHAQLALAAQFGWEDYPTPAGGCLLTDQQFSLKLRDFIAHDTLCKDDIPLLKYGRHFRLPNGAKLIVGRNEEENAVLEGIFNPKFAPVIVETSLGAPFSLISAQAGEDDLQTACRIILSFTKADPAAFYTLETQGRSLLAAAYPEREDAKKYLI